MIKIFFLTIALILISGMSNAGTKHEFTGKAFDINKNAEPITTITGISMSSWNNNSYWIYDDAPEGWPSQVRANCDGKGLFNSEGVPVTAYFICHV
jgi:hypothetical protein